MERIDCRPRLFVFYLVPDFTMLALTSAIEVLRLANAAVGETAYSWRLVSRDGARVTASCGLGLDVDGSVAAERRRLADAERPFMAVICGGLHIEDHVDKAAEAWLRECRQRAVLVAGLCNGAHILARAGLLADRRCTIHWENYPGFAERFRGTAVSMALYDADRGVHTCAGGTAAIDMMLAIVRQDRGEAAVNGVCERALIDRVRPPTDRQRLPFARRLGIINPVVASLVKTMEDNLNEPLAMEQLAQAVKLSRRQVERLFQSEMGCSPARYYMKLRLERARLLLLQTTIPVVEVAVATGFVSASHFAKCYREFYDCSPQATRNARTEASAPWSGDPWPGSARRRAAGAFLDRAA